MLSSLSTFKKVQTTCNYVQTSPRRPKFSVYAGVRTFRVSAVFYVSVSVGEREENIRHRLHLALERETFNRAVSLCNDFLNIVGVKTCSTSRC